MLLYLKMNLIFHFKNNKHINKITLIYNQIFAKKNKLIKI